LGDWYSVNWMEDSDKEDIEKETLQQQFKIVKNVTTTSHVMEYGDLTLGKLVVGYFQGDKPAQPKTYPKVPYKRGSPSWEVPLDILYKQVAAAKTEDEKQALKLKIDQMIEKRGQLEIIIKKIVTRVSVSREHEQRLTLARPQKLTKLDCHHTLVKAFSSNCFDFGKNTYALKYAYILANICEDGIDTDEVVRAMRQVCKAITIKDRID